MSPPVFYYDISSPYAYLAASRIDSLLPGAVWRPISFGILIREIGKRPWSLDDRRAAGLADIERRARERGLPPFVTPEGWPAQTYSLHPLRAAVHADAQGLLKPFTHAAYASMFADGIALDDRAAVLAAAERAGVTGTAEALDDPQVKQRLTDATNEAIARGVTGVPTVAVGTELYWGDDRLEEAAAAA